MEQDLTPVALTAEEQELLRSEGVTLPSGEDVSAQELQSVRSSDDLGAIENDLDGTNLSGLDSELNAIESDLGGL